jgi:hypothetical protein
MAATTPTKINGSVSTNNTDRLVADRTAAS